MRVLEVGAGPGRFGDAFAALGFDVMSSDGRREYVERMRARGRNAFVLDLDHESVADYRCLRSGHCLRRPVPPEGSHTFHGTVKDISSSVGNWLIGMGLTGPRWARSPGDAMAGICAKCGCASGGRLMSEPTSRASQAPELLAVYEEMAGRFDYDDPRDQYTWTLHFGYPCVSHRWN